MFELLHHPIHFPPTPSCPVPFCLRFERKLVAAFDQNRTTQLTKQDSRESFLLTDLFPIFGRHFLPGFLLMLGNQLDVVQRSRNLVTTLRNSNEPVMVRNSRDFDLHRAGICWFIINIGISMQTTVSLSTQEKERTRMNVMLQKAYFSSITKTGSFA